MISEKWSELAKSILGDESGRHCHWCKFIDTHDGIAECSNKDSPFYDGDRIRTWDGLGCAKKCPFFELDDWYMDDRNYDKIFED